MAKYTVEARIISYATLEVEADTAEEAVDIAENTDGGEFIPDSDPGSGAFDIVRVINEETDEEEWYR